MAVTPKKNAGKKAAKSVSPPTETAPMDISIQQIQMAFIKPDPNQPRKFFNEVELADLAQSIGWVGVIEPILLRAVGDAFMIVFGERRYRAAKIAKLKTIPAMIRDLTDEQALELQITENLQRHNPHPMEEAASFLKMKETRDVKEIAVRVGRSTKYVASRLLLNDLIPEFQEMFFLDKMDMQDAVSLAKIRAEDQAAIFQERTSRRRGDWRTDEHFSLGNIEWAINQLENNLDQADFKTEDPDLYPEADPCNSCKFNSANNLSLFIDEQKSRICSNTVCYGIKEKRNFELKLEKLAGEENIVFVAGYTYGNSSEEKQQLEAAKEMGLQVLHVRDYDEVHLEKPELEHYLDEDNFDFDEDDNKSEEEQRKEWEQEQRSRFEAEMADYLKEEAELQEQIASGKVKKAFVVCGHGAGDFTYIHSNESSKGDSDTLMDDAAAQRKKILNREERAKELDAEKIWESIVKFKRDDETIQFKSKDQLHLEELKAGCFAILKSIMLSRDVAEEFTSKSYYEGEMILHNMIEIADIDTLTPIFNRLIRAMCYEKLYDSFRSHKSDHTRMAGYNLMKHYNPDFIATAETAQADKAKKRQANMEARIKALSKQK